MFENIHILSLLRSIHHHCRVFESIGPTYIDFGNLWLLTGTLFLECLIALRVLKFLIQIRSGGLDGPTKATICSTLKWRANLPWAKLLLLPRRVLEVVFLVILHVEDVGMGTARVDPFFHHLLLFLIVKLVEEICLDPAIAKLVLLVWQALERDNIHRLEDRIRQLE